MTAARKSGFSLTENGWRALLLSASVIILVFTVYFLSQGITTIFMHLYYFPIILLAYHYHKKGVILSAVLGLLYVALVIFFVFPDVEVIAGALVRFAVFVGIAAVVSFLSETLERRELERNTIIANSEDGIFVVDLSTRMITEANLRGADMLGFTPGDLVNATLETIWQNTEERSRFSDLVKSGGRARTIEAHLTQKTGGTRTVLLSAGVLPENRIVLTVTDITEREGMLTEMRRLSEVRESIINNANVWLMVLDSRGGILEWNLAAEEISGYPAAEVIGGNDIWKRLYPERNYRKGITGKITEIIKEDSYLENLQTTIVCRDGTQKTILWNTRGLPDTKGVTGHYIAIGVDITDREKVEKVSREYAEWYSTLLRTTRDGYNLVDAAGRLLEVNDNYCRMTGFSREELLGKSISDLDADESKDAAFAHMQRILKTGSDRFEARHRTKSGGIIDVEVSVVLQPEKQQFIVFVRDITERKHAEKAISDSEEKFHTIADFTADWEYWQEQDKQIIYMSPSCERLTGYTQQEFLADPDLLETIVHPDDLLSVQEHNRVAWGTRQALTIDFRIIHRNGTVRWIGHSCRHVDDADGKARGRRVSNRDVTDRKLLEFNLKESEGRLKEILESMIAGVVIIDPETHTIIDVNSVAARMIGAQKNELIGSVCHCYICPAEIGTCPITDLEQIVDKSEKVLLTRSGEKIPIIKSVVPITIDHRPHLLESFIDISDLKRAESALRESEEKFRAFFTTSQDCVFITSVDGGWIDFNNTAVELFGYESREELMPVKIADLYAHPEERNAHVRIISEQGFTREYPIDLRKKDGTIINTLISSVARRDQKGSVIGFQGVIRDITELKRAEIELQELASVVRHSSELIGIAALDGKITFLNDAGARMLGILPADAIGKDFFRFIPDHLNEKIRTEVMPATMGQGIWSGDLEYINQKSGNLIDVHAMAFMITDPATGKPQYLANVSLDITDRKRAEVALRTSQIQLTEAMNLAHMANWELDVPTGIFTFNDRFYALCGTTAEREGGYLMPAEVYAKEFVHPDDMQVVSDEINKAIAATDPDFTRQIEHRIIRRDGEMRYIIVRFGITKNAEGRTVKTHGANQDITERKQAEEKLQESEERYRTVIENASEAIVVAQDGLFKFANPKTIEILQSTPANIIGHPFIDFIHPDDRELVSGRYQRRVKGENVPINYDFRFVGENGRIVWVIISAVRIQWEGRPATLNFLIDITERKQAEEALHNSQQILRTVLDTIPVRVFWKDRDLNYLGSNAPFAQDAGFHEPEELIGKDDYRMGWHEQAELYRADDRQVIESGKPKMLIEEPQTTPDGRTIWLLTSKTPLYDASGRINGVLGSYIDITERKQAEEAIKRSIERFRVVMDSIDALVYVTDMQTYELLFINKYGKDIWGEIEGKVCWQTIQSGQKGPCPFCTNDRLVDDNGNPTGIYNWEFQNTVNGRWYDCRDSAIRWLDGRLVRMEIATDITGRKQIEEALRESEQKFRDLFENSQDGIVIADAQTKKFVDNNQMFSHMLGYRPEEIKNLGLMDIHPEDSLSRISEVFEKIARHDMDVAENIPVRRKDGTIFYADISAYPISKSNKDYLVGVFRDITERRQAEELRRHFTEELEQQVRSRTQELETSLNEKVVLLREVHHRVKNNFQIIISLLSLQSREMGDEKVTRAMRESQNRIRAMAFVHETMYSSADFAHIDLESYVKYLTTQLFTFYGVRPGTISLNLDIKNIFIDINTTIPLGLVINELVSNSLKHAFPEGRKGRITISILDDQKGLTLTFRDNGIGFPEGFDWKATKSLGFTLIRVLIDQLDGTIEQEPAEGTLFIIRVMKKTDEQGHLHGTFNVVPE